MPYKITVAYDGGNFILTPPKSFDSIEEAYRHAFVTCLEYDCDMSFDTIDVSQDNVVTTTASGVTHQHQSLLPDIEDRVIHGVHVDFTEMVELNSPGQSLNICAFNVVTDKLNNGTKTVVLWVSRVSVETYHSSACIIQAIDGQ